MPTFDYKCDHCEHTQEYQERFEVGPDCDKCHRTMKRIWSAPGIHFKGTGWGGNHGG
jgi:putative FmdB family regulatory protein